MSSVIFDEKKYVKFTQLRTMNQSNPFFISCKESRIESPTSFYGCFYLGPFKASQSLTLGNALRRTLLSDLSGLAMTSVFIEGIHHEYSNLPGVRESVLDILLNLKDIVFRSSSDLDRPVIGYLQARGPGMIEASDLKLPKTIQCVDPRQYIATLNHDGNLNLKFVIQRGFHYQIQNPQKILNPDFPTFESKTPLTLDPVFTPIQKVNYVIESDQFYPYLANPEIDPFDFKTKNPLRDQNHVLILEIWTNGSLHPREALIEAIEEQFQLFSRLKEMTFLNQSICESLQTSRYNLQKWVSRVEQTKKIQKSFKKREKN